MNLPVNATRNPEPETASAHLAYHIHQSGLALLHDLYRLTQCLDKILRFGDRSCAPATIGSRHGAEVDVWIFDANADGFVFHRTIAHDGDAFLVLLIVKIGAVAANDDQQWNLVVHGCPKSADSEQQATVRLDVNAELTTAL